jgi:hypothetical protein
MKYALKGANKVQVLTSQFEAGLDTTKPTNQETPIMGKKDKEKKGKDKKSKDLKSNDTQLIKKMQDQSGRDNYIIYGARCTYPFLYDPPVYEGQTDKNSIKLIFEDKNGRDAEMIDQLQQLFESVGEKKWSNKKDIPDQSLWAFQEKNDQYQLSAKSEKAPVVVMPDGKTVATKQDCLIYSGCYVNLRIAIWAQDNKWGKRINSQLISAQFSGHGEALDGKTVTKEDAVGGFDEVKVDDGEDGLF